MNNQDEQLYIPEALHMMMMQIEAARIECNRMQADMHQRHEAASAFASAYQTPAIPVEPVAQESGVVIDARHRFLGRAASYIQA